MPQGIFPRKIKDQVGKRFYFLTVESFSHSAKNGTYWNARCDCGNLITSRINCMSSGNTKSCGCYNIKLSLERLSNHRESLKVEGVTNAESNRIEPDTTSDVCINFTAPA